MLPLGFVAVAVMKLPERPDIGVAAVIVLLPAPSVSVLIEPMSVWPSPLPAGSQEEFEKNSILYEVLGVELSVPLMSATSPLLETELITGKFCRLLAPVSASRCRWASRRSSEVNAELGV